MLYNTICRQPPPPSGLNSILFSPSPLASVGAWSITIQGHHFVLPKVALADLRAGGRIWPELFDYALL